MSIRRNTARVLPVDRDGRVLLLHGWDPRHPDEPYWFTIGGAIEAGESMPEAAARELREEAGIVVSPGQLGEPVGSSTIEFSWGDLDIIQDQTFFVVVTDQAEVSFEGQDEWERKTIDKHAWMTADEAQAHPDPIRPEVVALMRLAARNLEL